jgi:PmbA protein
MASQENADVEIFVLERDLRSIRIFRNEVVEAQDMVEEGIAIRVFKDGSMGFSITNIGERDQLLRAFKSALRMARSSNKIPNWSHLPKSDDSRHSLPLHLCDKKLAASTPEEVVDLALRMTKRLNSHEEIAYSLTGVLMVLSEKFSILNSYGLEHLSEPSSILHSRVIVETKRSEKYSVGINQFSTRKLSEFKPEEETNKAISMASEVSGLPEKPISNGRCDLILAPEALGGFISNLVSPMITGTSTKMGVSCFTGMLNKVIATDSFSLIDDGKLEDGLGSASVDDEGNPTRSTTIIEKGVLKNFLYDAITACQAGASSTGNAKRTSETLGRAYLTPPEPLPNNLIVKIGDYSTDELIQETSKGVLINSIDYAFPLVPERGYFNMTSSFPAFIIEDGQIVGHAQNIATSGVLSEVLMKIRGVGKHTRQSINVGSLVTTCPHLKIEDVAFSKSA